MKLLTAIAIAAVLVSACSPSKERQVGVFLVPDSSKPGQLVELPKRESDFIRGLLATPPTVDSKDYISLAPTTELQCDGDRYAVEENDLVLMHQNGTRIWKFIGLRERLMAALPPSKPNNSP